MKLRSTALAAALACAAVPLRAQDAPPPTPGLLRVAAAPDGTVLSIDSSSISRSGEASYWINTVYQYGPELARQYGFDRLVETQQVDCAGNRERPEGKRVYRGDQLIPAEDRGVRGEWAPVTEAELPLLQAICGTLRQSFAASLPVAYELADVEAQPSLANAPEVRRSLAREYPRALRDAGKAGMVVIRMRIMPDGHVDPQHVEVEQTNDPEFSAAAIRVAGLMRFTPARVKGEPVPVWVVLPVTFQVMSTSRSAENDPSAESPASPGMRPMQPPKGAPSLCSNVLVCPPHP